MKILNLVPLLCVFSFKLLASDYYVSPNGNDTNSGLSANEAWQNLAKVNMLALRPGDNIYFEAGQSFVGQLLIQQVRGTKKQPISVGTYTQSPEGAIFNKDKAHIDAGEYLSAIKIVDSSFINVSNIEATASIPISRELQGPTKNQMDMRVGVLVKTSTTGTYEGISLDNLNVHNIFYYSSDIERNSDEVRTSNGTQNYGWGIRVINNLPHATIKNLSITNSSVENVAHTGIKFTSKHKRIFDVKVLSNNVSGTGGPGIQLSGVIGGRFSENRISKSGSVDDPRKWGRGSGLWTWSSEKILIDKNHFTDANGPGDSAGVHIDFNCRDVVVEYNYSANNAGGFYEVLGNNYNTVYRYNISYNDGHRIKGKNGAFQEGKTFWLSGYNGQKNERKAPVNSYFYNNTIYVDASVVSKVAIDNGVSKVLVTNNIFHIIGDSAYVMGDQYKPDKQGRFTMENFVFENNLFLHKKSWPTASPVQDVSPIYGDAEFILPVSPKPEDFIPKNIRLVKDMGVFVSPIEGDTQGIYTGMRPKVDYMGKPIVGNPDMGAIEVQ